MWRATAAGGDPNFCKVRAAVADLQAGMFEVRFLKELCAEKEEPDEDKRQLRSLGNKRSSARVDGAPVLACSQRSFGWVSLGLCLVAIVLVMVLIDTVVAWPVGKTCHPKKFQMKSSRRRLPRGALQVSSSQGPR